MQNDKKKNKTDEDILKGMKALEEHKKNTYKVPNLLKGWKKTGMFDLDEDDDSKKNDRK